MFKSKGLFIATIDLLMAMVVVFFAMAAFALMATAKPTKPVTPPGTMMVQLFWDAKVDADVDLWLKAPGDKPVGYSNQNARFCNLLRDDLGRSEDSQSRNYELVVCRATPDGEYIVNAHLFSSHDQILPIGVRMGVSVGVPPSQIVTETGSLDHQGEELTLARFRLHDGHLVPDSVNQLPMALRSAAK